MKIAYLILAHRNPNLIAKVVDVLSCDESAFFVHIDKKTELAPFLHAKATNVFFCEERIPVYWAEYSMVEATIMLIKMAIAHKSRYDYFVLLSGSDYPLRNKNYIHRYIDERRGAEFISLAKIPNAEAGVPLSKINTFTVPSNKRILRFAAKALGIIGFAQRDYRKHLRGMDAYGGSTWWTLSRDACEYILDFIRKNEYFCNFFSRTLTSDEMFFHTILANSHFKSKIQRSLMYDDWAAGPLHPDLINECHIDLFASQNQVTIDDAFGPGELLFARKFSDDSISTTDEIDQIIRSKDNAV